MLLIDFEKAYDRIEWNFIIMMLKTFGFPPFFFKMVETLLRGATTCMEVNGTTSQGFSLSRSIRQGCSLVPTLFVLAVDALFYLLRDSSLSPLVKGIQLPNTSELLNIQFVDDTTILLCLDEGNIEEFMNKMDIFCLASGRKIYLAKSIMLGRNQHPFYWFNRLPLVGGEGLNINFVT